MARGKGYTHENLRVIARALNKLSYHSDKTKGVEMNTYHFTRFYNSTHYIDHHERYGFKVYKKYKGWQPDKEILSVPSWRKSN